MTKQQIIDALNEFTDDPNEEIFGYWEDHFCTIHDVVMRAHDIYEEKLPPSYPDPHFRMVPLHIKSSSNKICIDSW